MKSPGAGLVTLLGLLVLAVLAGLMLGAAPMSPAAVIGGLIDPTGDPTSAAIVRGIRLPRVAAGVFTGAALALSGTLFQALLRNPLAEPYLLGVSSGAAFGAVLSLTVVSSVGGPGLGAATTTIFALVGGLVAIAIVFRVASVVGRVDTRVLILAGVVVSAFFGAGVMLLLALARGDAFRSAVMWTMGSLNRATWAGVSVIALFTVVAAGISFGLSRHLNALALGEDAASHLGTDVERVKRTTYFVASLVAAATVSVAGVIGFVGLVVPHAVRMIWGADHRVLIPLSLLGGAAALVLSDSIAQTVVRPLVLPVGVITAVIGVPLFLVLLRRSHV